MKLGFLLLLSILARVAFASDPGITEKEILIGTHTTESGAFAAYSQCGNAMTAYYDMINEQGGIDGRKIKFIRIDAQSDFAKASEGVRKLVEQYNVFAIVGGVGQYHQAVYKYLIEKNVPDMFPLDGANSYTNPSNNFVFPAVYSNKQEGVAFANYAIKHLAGKKFCFLGTETTIGKEVPGSMIETFEKYNATANGKDKITVGPIESIIVTSVQADAQVSRLKAEKCDAVLSTGVPALSAAAVNYGFRHDFKPIWFFYRNNATDKLISLLDEGVNKDHFITSAFVATNDSSAVSGWANFQKLMEKNSIPVSGISAQGYFVAELFVETLRQAAKEHGHELTRAKYLKTVESLKDWKCSICFTPTKLSAQNHNALTPTLLTVKNNKWAVATD